MSNRKRILALILGLSSLLSAPAALAGGHPHHLALFGGATTLEGHTAGTAGADYEYRFGAGQSALGVGVLFDQAFGDASHSIVGAPLFFHPFLGAKFLAAPAMEISHGESHFLARVGAGYDIPLGATAYTLSPMFNLDFVEGHTAMVYGLAFGFGF